MEYIVTQISLVLSAFLLSLGTLFNMSIDVTTETIAATSTAQVINVIDGDTIDVLAYGTADPIRVRYIGIDTPEPHAADIPECGSTQATARNQELVGGQTVTLVPGVDPYDTYDRLLAYVYVDDSFINEILVEEGYATILMLEPNTRYEDKFRELYKNARLEDRGIWAKCE